jgi:dihydrofolate synthase/folylpolyglutamate synthase
MSGLDTIVGRLLALHPKKIDLSLDRMQRLLAALDHPERRLPPVIHVAGTNGKGSTVAFLRAMLEAAGQRVHVYTSPHLVRINERFRLAGGMLATDAQLSDAFRECETRNGSEPITVFEITTAAGFLLFSRIPADTLILEVGLGGRLDATNVIERPAASVITPISRDHVDFLGDTLGLIAAEKAGIIKPGVPAIIGRQPEEALAAIERAAGRARAPLHVAGEQWSAGEENGRLVYQDDDGLLDLPPPRLAGRHQFDNAGLAIAALRTVSRLPAEAYEAGVSIADWPARLQRLTAGALTALAPTGSELWLDGGHNAGAGRVLAAALADIEERVPRSLIMVVGMLGTKDLDGFLQNFTGLARRILAIPISDQENALAPDVIAEAARRVGIPAEPRTGLADAFTRIAQLDIAPPPRVLITGSLYLTGEALAFNGTPPT